MDRMRKADVLAAFRACPDTGIFPAQFSPAGIAKNNLVIGSFEGKRFCRAKEVFDLYVANILRQHQRFCVVKRDVQMYYLENEPPYTIAINPPEDECIEDEENEIALVARGDGNGHFIFCYYDETFWKDYTADRSSVSVADIPLHQRKRTTIKKDLLFLGRYKTLYSIVGESDDVVFFGIGKQKEKVSFDFSRYGEYITPNHELSNGVLTFYRLVTMEEIEDRIMVSIMNTKREFLQREIDRLEAVLVKRRLELEELAV
jgi:hypothetical protein